MNFIITLHLTSFPVREPETQKNPPPRYTGMLIEGKKTFKEFIGDADMSPDRFTEVAISWAEIQLQERKLKIDIVSGDAAVRSVVESRGLTYQSKFDLS